MTSVAPGAPVSYGVIEVFGFTFEALLWRDEPGGVEVVDYDGHHVVYLDKVPPGQELDAARAAAAGYQRGMTVGQRAGRKSLQVDLRGLLFDESP